MCETWYLWLAIAVLAMFTGFLLGHYDTKDKDKKDNVRPLR